VRECLGDSLIPSIGGLSARFAHFVFKGAQRLSATVWHLRGSDTAQRDADARQESHQPMVAYERTTRSPVLVSSSFCCAPTARRVARRVLLL